MSARAACWRAALVVLALALAGCGGSVILPPADAAADASAPG